MELGFSKKITRSILLHIGMNRKKITSFFQYAEVIKKGIAVQIISVFLNIILQLTKFEEKKYCIGRYARQTHYLEVLE